jgi:glycosyltransferase involved in cell wall biosynthesis
MPSGIADYSSEIIPYLGERADIDVFCPRPGRFSRARVPRGATLQDPRRFDELLDRYDACFYQLGNNPYHEFVYKAAKDRPGIAEFHDANLHHLIAWATFESRRDFAGYTEILREELGETGGRVATLRRLGLGTEFEKFVFPLTAHVASRAKGIVVHSEDARLKMLDIAPDVPMTVIPHHAGEPPEEVRGITREEARRRLGIPLDAFAVGHLGFITKPKQPAAVVGGFARLYREFPNALLYMVGSDRTGGALSKLIHDLGVAPAVRLAGYVDLVNFYLYIKALDATINLRYPSAGESSGTFARGLAEGRCVIVNNYGSFAEVPSEVALKVEIDSPQAEQVGEHLLHLARQPEFRASMEQRAREYAWTVLDPTRVRDLYLAFAERVGPPLRKAEDVRVVRRARPATLTESVARRHQLGDRFEEVSRSAFGRAGMAVYVDLVYRELLRRPATDEEIREAHAAMAAGTLTRAELVRRIVASPEFTEVALLDELVHEVLAADEPFRLSDGTPVGPGTSERVVAIPWMLSRWAGAPRVLDVGYAGASGIWTSALVDLGIPSLHGVDRGEAVIPGYRRTCADPSLLPYRDGSFQLVFTSSMPRDEEAMAELVRVTAPGGRIVLAAFVEGNGETVMERSGLTIEERERYVRTSEGWVPADGAEGGPAVFCFTLRR